LIRPDARCPKCGARPKVDFPASTVALFVKSAPGAVVQTYECHVSWCGTRYPIHARALHTAA